MLTRSIDTLLEIVDGQLLQGDSDVMVNGIAIDSRHVEPGNAFIAFPGEHVDGHAFLDDAVASGARALLVTDQAAVTEHVSQVARERGAAIVLVSNAERALQDIASAHRAHLFCPVVGVTGSTGKTSTKDFLTSALATKMKVVATRGNQNNELGVPLTILRAGADTDVLVVEMAMRGRGQIARLCEIAKPTLGLITNVGTSHIELLGTEEAVARAKSELLESLPEGGTAFINADSAFAPVQMSLSTAPVTTYGLSESADVRAEEVEVDEASCASFDLVTGEERFRISLGVPGRHNVYNALAASAVCMQIGLSSSEIAEGLAAAKMSDMRMQVFQSASGVTVVNDAYNANPTSMRAALKMLSEYASTGKRVAVLGDMAELGSLTELAHFQMGERVAQLGIDVLVTVGPRARRIGEGASAEGMNAEDVRPCATAEEASEVLDDLLSSGDVVLVKASRVMGLERVVEGIVKPHV